MKTFRLPLLALLSVFALVSSGNGCGYSDDDPALTLHSDPDRPYSAFVAGKLGVLSNTLRIRHLVVAYDHLSGRGLSRSEQQAAIDVDRFYNLGPDYQTSTPPPSALWKVGGLEHTVPSSPYESFTNCLGDAFTHADRTLGDLRSRFNQPNAPDTPEIQDWIAAQQVVFSNCTDQDTPHLPAPAAASAPLWLRQQRAYQRASAQLYALQFDQALAGFQAIASDKVSPMAPLARYLVARVLIRRATVPYAFAGPGPQVEVNNRKVLTGLAEARDQLQAILKDLTMHDLHPPAAHLLDYVMIRLDPPAQAEVLARRLGTTPTDYRQNAIDLTFAFNSLPLYTARPTHPIDPQAPLLRWIIDLSVLPAPDMGRTVASFFSRDAIADHRDALVAWRQAHEAQWLAAALATAPSTSPDTAELLVAARQSPANSPAWPTVTYHRLRLTPASPDLYREVTALVPEVDRTQPRSTLNLFTDLEAALAPTLDMFLRAATTVAAPSIQSEPGEGFPMPTTGLPSEDHSLPVTLCGINVNDPNVAHLDPQAALILNQRLPLELLKQAALSPILPGNVRFQLAHSAWTRALLLDRPDIAQALAPYLAQCQPAFKAWLDPYAAATNPADRHLLGLLAMARFTSAEPTVRIGIERDFASYSDTRDNWWCDLSAQQTTPTPPHLFSQTILPRQPGSAITLQPGFPYSQPAALPDPSFLTANDRATADRENAALEHIPAASDYFARQALDWVAQHPDDRHNADLLGFASRVVRNACRTGNTSQLNHQLFDILQGRYPGSEWARRYTTWE